MGMKDFLMRKKSELSMDLETLLKLEQMLMEYHREKISLVFNAPKPEA